MASYRIAIKRSAAKELERIGTRKDREAIASPIRALAADPRPAGCERLAGRSSVYRIRQGDCRILYSIEDEGLVVLVIRIGHRRDVYR